MRFLPKFTREHGYALTTVAGNLLLGYCLNKNNGPDVPRPSSAIVYPVSQQFSESETKALTTGESTSNRMKL